MERDLKNFVYDNAFSNGAYWVCSGEVIAVMTGFFEIPLAVSNLLAGLTSTLCCLQLFGALFFSRARSRYGYLITTNLIWRMLIPMIFATALLPKATGGVVFSVLVFIMVAVYQLVQPPQNDWLAHTAEGRAKPNYYSVREMGFMLVYTFGFCAANLIIDRATKSGALKPAFLIIGAIELAFLALSMGSLFNLPRAVAETPRERKPFLSDMKHVFKNAQFMKILVSNAIWTFSCMFIGSYAAVYQVRSLGVTFSMIMIYATVANLARSVLSLYISRVAGRITWKATALASIAMMACSAAGWFFITKGNMGWLFPILSLLGALPYAGYGIAVFTLQIDATRGEDRTPYFSLIATVNGLAAMLGSALCSGAIGIIEAAAPDKLHLIFAAGFAGLAVCAAASLRLCEPKADN